MKTILISIGSAVVALGIIGGVIALKNNNADTSKQSNTNNTQEAKTMDTSDTNTQGAQLQSTDEVVGTGAEATSGKKVTVHYVGTFPDGRKFDASRDRGDEGFSFTLGAGEVIKGWDQGVAGMKVGGKRKLVVPPELGYGSTARGTIPANSTLHFDVELLKVD